MMLPKVPGYREYDFISISKGEYNELKEQNSKRIIKLLAENQQRRELLRQCKDWLKDYLKYLDLNPLLDEPNNIDIIYKELKKWFSIAQLIEEIKRELADE